MALSLQRYCWSDFSSGLNYLLKERSQEETERSIIITIKVGEYLPESLIIEILSWLPVKDLLKLKSVCKSWNAIISSPNFISKHLNNYYINNDTWRSCLLLQYYATQAEIQLLELLVDESPRVLAHEVLYSIPTYPSYVCGPCDGIYYLYTYSFGIRILWNPAINEFKTLPPLLVTKPNLPFGVTYFSIEDYGFGLDPITKDYKVVVIRRYCSTTDEDLASKYPLSIFVYSLWNDSWRYCGDLTKYFDIKENYCYNYLNGFCYWMGSSENDDKNDCDSKVIISFDMGTDASEEICVPNYAQPSSNCICVYDGCLAFLSLHSMNKMFDIWTLKKGCWTKKLSIGPLSDIWNPIGHWKDNYILLESYDSQLILLDPNSQELKDLGFQFERNCYGVYAFMESLVSFKNKSKSRLHLEELEDENNHII